MCGRIRNRGYKEGYAKILLRIKNRLFVKQTYAQAKKKLRLN